jgi:NADH-quinone oxidoreductase subunit M
MNSTILTWMTFLPLLGAVVIFLFVPKESVRLVRRVAMFFSLVALAAALCVVTRFDAGNSGYQLVQKTAWMNAIHVDYYVGVDGLSVVLVLLTAVLTPLAIWASWGIEKHVKAYFILFLILQTAMFGVFTALNFVHWFLFWEAGLVPAFFLIKLWGGENRHYAALKFFLYTLLGSITMFLAFQAMYLATGEWNFDKLAELGRNGDLATALGDLAYRIGMDWPAACCAYVVFLGVLLGFAVKVPIWPLHTWLPDAYTEAPTATSMVLTGILSKMGVYGFLRILLPIFPDEMARSAGWLAVLALITIVFGAVAGIAQKDIKRMISYSSINHVAFCILGIVAVAHSADGVKNVLTEKAAALNGTILQMFTHGISAAALFYLAGVLQDRAGGQRDMTAFGGLRKTMPVFCGLMGISAFASLGLPGLSGFVSEFLIFKGALPILTPVTVLATVGLLATAIFLLRMLQFIFYCPLNERWKSLPDLSGREIATAAPFVAFMFFIGIYPGPLVDLSNAWVVELIQIFS